MPIVTDHGFQPDDTADYLTPDDLPSAQGYSLALRLPNDADPTGIAHHFARLALIAVPFPSFADGRGFSLAKRLRDLGYTGRLRAEGHVIADQYAFARACGFDEVRIDDALARRQPEAVWRRAIALPSYRAKLRGRVRATESAA